jgi:sortase A
VFTFRAREFAIVTCLFALGFSLAVSADRPVADALLAQAVLHKAWDPTHQSAATDFATRWPRAAPAMRLLADAGNVDLIVLSGLSADVLALGPGHLPSSSLPGEAGNAVIAGRRETFFRFLADLEPGDALAVETPAGQKHLYRVIGVDVVDARRSSVVLNTELPMLTLVTGYPFDPGETADSLRYVVTARMLF